MRGFVGRCAILGCIDVMLKVDGKILEDSQVLVAPEGTFVGPDIITGPEVTDT